jgi:endogenous inhibitor of DNA gyrase (YacG/DUF329 family)
LSARASKEEAPRRKTPKTTKTCPICGKPFGGKPLGGKPLRGKPSRGESRGDGSRRGESRRDESRRGEPAGGETQEHAYRPFCSKRCADIDLARWLDGRYAIAGAPADKSGGEDEDEDEGGPG